MRALPRGWLVLAGLVTAAVLTPLAFAGSAASIKGVGAGETNLGFTQFELSAHVEDDPTTPENGFGQVKVELFNGSFAIDVRCVEVSVVAGRPNARISGVITQSTFVVPFGTGQRVLVVVADGGEPASDVPVDSFTISSAPPASEDTICLGVFEADVPRNVTQGNIVVKD